MQQGAAVLEESAGDPALLRLPAGLELELAALGDVRQRVPGSLHGGTREPPALTVGALRQLRAAVGDPLRWPPTAEESSRLGDSVSGQRAQPLIALDFGVREWVLDLPYLRGSAGQDMLELWLGDHATHVERAMAFAVGDPLPERLESLDALAAELALKGVVRGVAAGEAVALVDVQQGAVSGRDSTPLPPGVPGVVRTLVVHRSGRGLLDGEPDPHLSLIGFRFAGGAAFVREVRR